MALPYVHELNGRHIVGKWRARTPFRLSLEMRCEMKSDAKKRQYQLSVLQVSENVTQIVIRFIEYLGEGHKVHDPFVVNAIEFADTVQCGAQLVYRVINIVGELLRQFPIFFSGMISSIRIDNVSELAAEVLIVCELRRAEHPVQERTQRTELIGKVAFESKNQARRIVQNDSTVQTCLPKLSVNVVKK